jgi:hypothetical protein
MGRTCSTHGEIRNITVYKLLGKEINNLQDAGINMGIILRQILKKWDVRVWTSS